jgi:ornithine cyclodeaminase/alanine dehydrogenase-like protein (mu-crystallin family)
VTLVLTRSEVSRLIDMEKAIAVMENVFRQQREGKIVGHPSFGLQAEKGGFRIHAGGLLGSRVIGTRMFPAGTDWPENARERQIALLYDTESAELLCVSASPFGRLRIGSVMGLAAKYLSPPGSSKVVMIGTGGNAPSIIEAVLIARPSVEQVWIYSRDRGRRERFAREIAPLVRVEIRIAENAEEAVKGKEIVLTSTDSPAPVVQADWISPGAYFASSGMTSEVGTDIIERAGRIVLSSREQFKSSPGRKQDALTRLVRQGRLSWGDTDELGDVVAGEPGRSNPALSAPPGITVFLQTSGGFPELALNEWTYRQAVQLGLGWKVELWD